MLVPLDCVREWADLPDLINQRQRVVLQISRLKKVSVFATSTQVIGGESSGQACPSANQCFVCVLASFCFPN
jgi:hypothetical protein